MDRCSAWRAGILAVWMFFAFLAPARAGELRVLATTFPLWLITRNVLDGADAVGLDLMIPAQAGCPHDYVLSPRAVYKLEQADIVIRNGLGMDDFLDRAPAGKPGRIVLDSSAGLSGVLSGSPEPGAEDRGTGEIHGTDGSKINPHLFASPRLAALLARGIGAELARLDERNSLLYRRNAGAYAEKLERLAEDFRHLGGRVLRNRIVAQHSIFDYLAQDAGLRVVAVLQAEEGHEPSAAAMLRLIREIRQQDAAAIVLEPQYPVRAGEAVARATGVPCIVLDPVASGPSGDLDALPPDYYEIVMRDNLRVLEQALGVR